MDDNKETTKLIFQQMKSVMELTGELLDGMEKIATLNEEIKRVLDEKKSKINELSDSMDKSIKAIEQKISEKN